MPKPGNEENEAHGPELVQGIFIACRANEDTFTKQEVGVGRRKAEPGSASPSPGLPCCACRPADDRHCGADKHTCSNWRVA